jgi:hypothetical protein
MKVSFKLTPAQLIIAQAILAKVPEWSDDGNDSWAGNMMGYCFDHPCYNANQALNLIGQYLTYEGERCPMLQDGHMAILRKVFQDDLSTARVILYDTSDKRLIWSESLSDYIEKRATLQEVVEYVKKEAVRLNHKFSYLLTMGHLARHEGLVETIGLLLSEKDSRANASFDKKTINAARALIPLVTEPVTA